MSDVNAPTVGQLQRQQTRSLETTTPNKTHGLITKSILFGPEEH